MKPYHALEPIAWAKRVNRTWLTKGGLNRDADEWMKHLAACGGGRLKRSCENARAMCGFRDPLDDPKPWFYTGLFSLATAEEAKRFLANHRITKAAVPSMRDDEDVILWLDRVGPETLELIERLRAGIKRLPDH